MIELLELRGVQEHDAWEVKAPKPSLVGKQFRSFRRVCGNAVLARQHCVFSVANFSKLYENARLIFFICANEFDNIRRKLGAVGV